MRILIALLALTAPAAASESGLTAYIANLKQTIPRSGSKAFIVPSAADRAKFVDCVEKLLGGNPSSARGCLESLNYTLTPLTDPGQTYWIAAERKEGFKGLGTYIVNPQYIRNLVLESPHPIFDTGTLEESGEVFQKVGARALFIPGTHRCANLDSPSGCDGKTNSCGGQSYRNSDAAHFVGNFFTAAHEATLRLKPQPMVISVHGSGGEVVDAELSDGSGQPAPADAFVNRLRTALIKRGVKAGSCNWPADDPKRFHLCGGTNVQGRITNGIIPANACTVASGKSAGLFVHIEQMRNVRTNPDFLAGAIVETMPAER